MDPKPNDIIVVNRPDGEHRGWVKGLDKKGGRRVVRYALDRSAPDGEHEAYFPNIKTVNGIKPPLSWQSR